MNHVILGQEGEDVTFHFLIKGPDIDLVKVYEDWILNELGPMPKSWDDTLKYYAKKKKYCNSGRFIQYLMGFDTFKIIKDCRVVII